jgi:hypothetical protein
VFFKYYTDDGKGDDEESEDSESDEESENNESKDLLLKEIELIFENGYFYKDVAVMFSTFYKANIERINLLYTQVLEERFKRNPTLMFQKDIDIYKSRQNQIETIEKRKTLPKAIKRNERKKESEEDSNISSYKRYIAKKDFESALNNEIKKVEEQKPIKRKSERNDTPEVSEEEDEDTEN